MQSAIKNQRLKAGLTQEQLSEKLKLSSSGTVSMWETGARTPKVRHLKAMSKLFKCTVDDLLKGK